jgi:uncharacterized Zn finger protein
MTDGLSPITLRTVGDLLDHGYTLSAWCPSCHRFGKVDLHAVAERLGRDRSYLRPSVRYRCKECGTVTDHGQIAQPSPD